MKADENALASSCEEKASAWKAFTPNLQKQTGKVYLKTTTGQACIYLSCGLQLYLALDISINLLLPTSRAIIYNIS